LTAAVDKIDISTAIVYTPQVPVIRTLYQEEKGMKLWVTPKGDRWLCDECQKELQENIDREQWRAALEEFDPMLRCSACKHGDVDIFD
jgi:hypothetical protein